LNQVIYFCLKKKKTFLLIYRNTLILI
jgi:hypothetical protein